MTLDLILIYVFSIVTWDYFNNCDELTVLTVVVLLEDVPSDFPAMVRFFRLIMEVSQLESWRGKARRRSPGWREILSLAE